MDVQCERCKTEYEFDDALVSGRGTTVRCTTCGHQFKVRRPETAGDEAGDASDRWVVKTATGQQFTFLTLRELQRAILAHQVSRADLLRRAGSAPRPLGSINELEPFFEGKTSSTRPPPRGPASFGPSIPADPMVPVAFPKRESITWEEDPPTAVEAPGYPGPAGRYDDPSPGPGHAARRKVDTLRPGGSAAPPQGDIIQPQPVVSAAGLPAPAWGAPAAAQMPSALSPGPGIVIAAAPASDLSSPLPPPTRPVRRERERSSGDYDFSDEMRPAAPSYEEAYSTRRGRRVGGWVVALVLLLAVGVLGWALARPYFAARAASASAQLDPRAGEFLAQGERAMTYGNLEQAQEDLEKASALAENDPRVRLDEARLAAAQADVPWLKLKIRSSIPTTTTAGEDDRMVKAEAAARIARAGGLADAALASAPESPSAYRAKIDALRLSGQQDAARKLVTKIITQASQPETAYVLAALDLAEAEPLWTTVIERLRLAAAGESNAGRARAALVYALAKSGDAVGAAAELTKLDGLPRPYPVSPSLHALLEKSSTKPAPTVDGGAEAGLARGPRMPSAPPASSAVSQTPALTSAGGEAPGDTRSAMQLAAQAYKRGDLGRARQIYEAIATRTPGDSEAVAALGDIARAEGDSKTAIASYKRAININPSYLPALVGLADTQWANGDRAGAAHGYGDIVDRFPEGTYPGYVKQRAESLTAAPAESTKPAASSPSVSPTSPPSPDESTP